MCRVNNKYCKWKCSCLPFSDRRLSTHAYPAPAHACTRAVTRCCASARARAPLLRRAIVSPLLCLSRVVMLPTIGSQRVLVASRPDCFSVRVRTSSTPIGVGIVVPSAAENVCSKRSRNRLKFHGISPFFRPSAPGRDFAGPPHILDSAVLISEL